MTSEGHFTFSFASNILAKKMILTPALAQGDWWHIFAGGIITCLLPDIDHPKSLIGQRLIWISIPVSRICGHRGFTHSLLSIIIIILLYITVLSSQIFIPSDVLHAMIIGYLSHIIADMLTPSGVPLLWPCKWRFRLPILNSSRNNFFNEKLVCTTMLIVAIKYPEGVSLIKYPVIILDYIQNIWIYFQSVLLFNFN